MLIGRGFPQTDLFALEFAREPVQCCQPIQRVDEGLNGAHANGCPLRYDH